MSVEPLATRPGVRRCAAVKHRSGEPRAMMRPSSVMTTFCCPPVLIRSVTALIEIGVSTPSIQPTPRP
ncbi:hypothetical protein [Cryobacterium sp. TMT2-42-4]|uniref:hypothetical protein n=1 Tax=Cryobacterium sp. TMT2-42-4 TaxID=1259255 RepID=UPI001F540C01|nr:hypothetical protein [Cryobacterium sp. TMT2-42-4]